MVKKLTFALLWLWIAVMPVFGQNLTQSFQKAYFQNPNLPSGILEALSYANTRFTDVRPAEENAHDHHHGPARWGVFGLIEDGEGFFDNNLTEVCRFNGLSKEQFLSSSEQQILATAAYLSALCKKMNVNHIEQSADLLREFSEIKNTNKHTAYGRELYVYEVYFHLKNGIKTPEMSLSAQNINFKNFFEENTYQILSAPQVVISKDGISNGEQTFRMNGNDNENDKPVENIFSADYAPALWVSSPNYSSRNGSGVSAVTIHTVQGSYAGCISWFQNTSSNVSAHYVIRSSDGQVTQMVLESNKAWHVGSENPYTVGIEHEGYINNASWYTTAMYQSSANLVKDICTSNGIAKTSCYSGASSSGINVLSSAYKIKGHQHYPNQSHTDPGINWNWGTYYNLINGGTCGTPASLASSSITSTGAVLTWGAVSGATNYSLQIKTSAGSTWTAYTVSGTSYTKSGLTAATAYQWKVAANCSGTLSSYSATASFTTANAPSCTSASGLFSTNVGTAVATLNWSVLSGATGYNVRWKISTSGTWTNGTTTGNTLNIASLTPASTYNWEVQRVCSSGAAAWVAGANFTTKASCYDAYESNNSSSTATALSMEQVALAKICGSGDVDWYKVTLTATTSFKFVASSLPTDYNVELYVGGAYVSGSYNSGTTTESITLTSKPAGTYYFRVYGAAAGNYSNLYDYKVKATTNMSYTGEAKASVINGETGLEENHARTEEMAENAQIDVENLILYPNPAAENCKIAVQLPQASSIRVLLIDTKGSLMSDFTQEGNQGANEISLPIEKLSNGLYIVKMFMLNQNFERKLLIQK